MSVLMEWIYRGDQPFIWHPERAWAIALVFVVVFGVMLRRHRHQGRLRAWGALVPALAWFGFGWLEFLAKRERADIRVDLLVTWPVVLGITLVSAVWLWRDFKAQRRDRSA